MKNLILLGMILFFVLFYASTVSAQCQGNVFTISLSWKTEKSVHGFTSTERVELQGRHQPCGLSWTGRPADGRPQRLGGLGAVAGDRAEGVGGEARVGVRTATQTQRDQREIEQATQAQGAQETEVAAELSSWEISLRASGSSHICPIASSSRCGERS